MLPWLNKAGVTKEESLKLEKCGEKGFLNILAQMQ
jgi:hypothetical protein